MRALWAALATAALAVVVALVLVWSSPTVRVRPVEVAELNDLARQVGAAWGDDAEIAGLVEGATGTTGTAGAAEAAGEAAGAADPTGEAASTPPGADATGAAAAPPRLPAGTEVSVVAADGTVVAAHGPPIGSALQAAGRRALTLPVYAADGTQVAALYAADPVDADLAAASRAGRWAATAAIGVATAGLLAAALVIERRVLRPFRRLEAFAQDVAGGRLDAPLEMDRANAFGAWTESFDLMRTELAAARAAEARAREDTRTTVAQLSHDVRTPVASIMAATDVLALGDHDDATRDRLGVVAAKAAQIDALVADLFVANRDQLAALPLHPAEVPAADLAAMVHLADVDRRAQVGEPPAALVRVDPRRMQQVIDNVVTNAYKHAGTPLSVDLALDGEFVRLTVADAGPGVTEGELGTIFGRGVRGSAVGDVPGHGLGLYTCAHLMERMGGGIAAANRPGGGLAVRIDVPLA